MRGSRSSAWPSHSCISRRVRASRAPKGSSRHRTGLPDSSVRRNATRWRMPPDSSCGRARSKPSRPKAANSGCARARASSREAPASRAASAALSIARSHGSRPSRWGMSTAGAARTVPASGVCRPQTSSSSVVLPQPLGPTTATVSPAATSRSTASSARTAPNARLTPARWTSPSRPSNVTKEAPVREPRASSSSLPPRALPHRFEGSAPDRAQSQPSGPLGPPGVYPCLDASATAPRPVPSPGLSVCRRRSRRARGPGARPCQGRPPAASGG